MKGKIVIQCPQCKDVGIRTEDGKIKKQPSIVEFPRLPKKVCYGCKAKNNEKSNH